MLVYVLFSVYRYYLNVERCAAGGITSTIRGPKFYVMNDQCDAAYYLHPQKGYKKYGSGRDFSCSFKSNPCANYPSSNTNTAELNQNQTK